MPTRLFFLFFISHTITPFFVILQSYPIENANKKKNTHTQKKNTNDSMHMCMSDCLSTKSLWNPVACKKTDYKLP